MREIRKKPLLICEGAMGIPKEWWQLRDSSFQSEDVSGLFPRRVSKILHNLMLSYLLLIFCNVKVQLPKVFLRIFLYVLAAIYAETTSFWNWFFSCWQMRPRYLTLTPFPCRYLLIYWELKKKTWRVSIYTIISAMALWTFFENDFRLERLESSCTEPSLDYFFSYWVAYVSSSYFLKRLN